jgi:hypothetical protein
MCFIYQYILLYITWILISPHLHFYLPSGLSPSGFHTKILYECILSPIRTTCSAHLIYSDYVYNIHIVMNINCLYGFLKLGY